MADPAIVAGNQAAPGKEQESQISWMVDAIVAALDADISKKMLVAKMPDKLQDYDLGQREGAILVHYRGSKYGPAAGGAQPREMTFDAHVLVRGLDGPFGATVQVEGVRLSLQGRELQGGTAIALQSDGLVQEKDGVWNYVVTFTATLPAVARRQPDWRPY